MLELWDGVCGLRVVMVCILVSECGLMRGEILFLCFLVYFLN